ARHRYTVGRQHDITLLDAGISGWTACLLDHNTTLGVGLALLLAGQRPDGEAQLTAALRLLDVAGGPLVLPLCQPDAAFPSGVLSPDLQLHVRSGRESRDDRRQLVGLIYRVAVDLQNHVTRLDARMLRRTAFLDIRDQRTFGLRQAEGVGQGLVDVLDDHT